MDAFAPVPQGPDPAKIRPARPEESALLGDLAVRGAQYWGTDPAYVERQRVYLTPSPADITTFPTYVYDDAGTIRGFYGLMYGGSPVPLAEGEIDLHWLFIEPSAIGQGYGTCLWHHAVGVARHLGYQRMVIESDAHAEGFYVHMGAQRVRFQMMSEDPPFAIATMHLSLSGSTG
jgi:GNAT superfamily N-acetyltransferase